MSKKTKKQAYVIAGDDIIFRTEDELLDNYEGDTYSDGEVVEIYELVGTKTLRTGKASLV